MKEKRACLEQQRQSNAEVASRIETSAAALEQAPQEISEWNESVIRQLVDSVKVLSKEQIEVYLRGGEVVNEYLK